MARLVNIGLGDGWGRALVASLPRMMHLRVLDVTHNYLSTQTVRLVTGALKHNHSLLWLQLLPQWLSVDRDAERDLGAALSTRRIKADLAVRAAKGVLSSRGEVGEPSASFEWRGAMLSTGAAHPTASTLNPKWEEHFNICVPSSLLWPPSRTPVTLSLLDLRRSAQLASDPPMGFCELPLGALLLADPKLTVRCAVQRHASAAAIGKGGGAELHLELGVVHVGADQDDDDKPGVPAAWKQMIAAERRAEQRAAVLMQAGWHMRGAKDEVERRRKLRAELGSVAERAKKAHDEAVHQRRLSDGGDGGGGPLFALLARLRECITGGSASQPPLLPCHYDAHIIIIMMNVDYE